MGTCPSIHKSLQQRRWRRSPAPSHVVGLATPIGQPAPMFRILILGSGESGKSTILKQIRHYQHSLEISSDLKKFVQIALCENTLDCLRALAKALRRIVNNPNDEYEAMLCGIEINRDETRPVLPQTFIEATGKFLGSTAVVDLLEHHRNEFWILDAHPYYFGNLARFASCPFEFQDEDYIFARMRTIGVETHSFAVPNTFSTLYHNPKIIFEMIDLAGQKSQRRKWIQYFDNVDAITFVVNLSGYATRMFEESTTLRMDDELNLFTSIVTNDMFRRVRFCLILNKKDIFEQLLRRIPLTTCFPDYTGPPHDVGEALAFVSEKFRSVMPEAHRNRVAIFFMSARVRREVKCTFEDIWRYVVTNTWKQ